MNKVRETNYKKDKPYMEHTKEVYTEPILNNTNMTNTISKINELIKVTENNGQKIVSARELYVFLKVKSKYADWIKNRIYRYDFIEDKDYVTFSKNLENGGRTVDHGLTLDVAKEISMVENNDQGKQARRYFIEIEKKSREVTYTLSPAEQLLLNAQLLVEQEKKLNDFNNRLSKLESVREQHLKDFTELPLSKEEVPDILTKDKVRLLVNRYANACGLAYYEVWNRIYSDLNYMYHVNIKKYKNKKKDSLIDVAVREGHVDKIHSIISDYLREIDIETNNMSTDLIN